MLYDNVGVSIYSTVTLPHLAGEAVRGDLGAALQTAYLRHGAHHSDHLRAAGQQLEVTRVWREQIIYFVKKYTNASITNTHINNINTANTTTSTYTNNTNTSTNSMTAGTIQEQDKNTNLINLMSATTQDRGRTKPCHKHTTQIQQQNTLGVTTTIGQKREDAETTPRTTSACAPSISRNLSRKRVRGMVLRQPAACRYRIIPWMNNPRRQLHLRVLNGGKRAWQPTL